MDFQDLLNYCQAQAIANTLEGNEVTVWRSLCRSYSKSFHTPLYIVLDMDPEHVMLSVFEEQLDEFDEEKDIESILDKIYSLEDPDYENSKKEELDEFIRDAELEEQERIKEGKPIHKALRSQTSLESLPEMPARKNVGRPTGGTVDLSHLETEENGTGQFEE